jgi:aminoglycoside phosphotransferase (APT) family kinase protein
MAAPQRDPAETARRLRDWFVDTLGVEAVEISGVTIPPSTGFSNETILFDGTWTDGGQREVHELVARIAPTSYRVFHDETFLLQFHLMRALADRTDVPMPAIHWLEAETSWFGSPFWIMERVRGDIPSDTPPYAETGWLAAASEADQARAWASGIEAMATLHRVDVDALAIPAELLVVGADPTGAELDRYARYLHWAEQGEPHPLARHALDWLQRNQPADPPHGPTVVWGDSRLSNLVYRDFQVAAVLDWEMAAVADPLLDLGWWIFSDETLTVGSGRTRLPGFESEAETAARWQSLTGRAVDDLPYYLVFAGLRFTIIMLRMGKLLAEMGLLPATFPYDNFISQGLERELRRQ